MGCSVLHLFILDKFKKKCGEHCDILSRNKVRSILYWSHVPVRLHNDFLKEMEQHGLIKIVNRVRIKIM
jgi:predicted methyltransferase